MSDSQIAKIIMALNNLNSAKTYLSEAAKEGGAVAPSLIELIEKLRDCEDQLNHLRSKR